MTQMRADKIFDPEILYDDRFVVKVNEMWEFGVGRKLNGTKEVDRITMVVGTDELQAT